MVGPPSDTNQIAARLFFARNLTGAFPTAAPAFPLRTTTPGTQQPFHVDPATSVHAAKRVKEVIMDARYPGGLVSRITKNAKVIIASNRELVREYYLLTRHLRESLSPAYALVGRTTEHTVMV